MGAEERRLEEARRGRAAWKRWGPFLSERQWGTVREDYSADGDAWGYFPFEHAHRRAYRWGEDGLAGICDDGQRLCLALALWNGRDPILKERLFGLSGEQGNHGEDVKELYYFLDATPTYSYLRMLYKYPQAEFPYAELIEENGRRGPSRPEYELLDTGAFDGDRYFDVLVEYAKEGPDELLLRITAHNRGDRPADLHLLPQLWFRNTWSWGRDPYRPRLARRGASEVGAEHRELGRLVWQCEPGGELLFCDNDSDPRVLGLEGAAGGRFKDGIHRYLIDGEAGAVHPEAPGTKCALHVERTVAAGEATVVRARLAAEGAQGSFAGLDETVDRRRAEADAFYAGVQTEIDDEDARRVHRQALAGMLWSQQYYAYDVRRWLEGDPAQPPPPAERRRGRNHRWRHLHNAEVISMPDSWEYPWYAGWDLAFHCLPVALVDPDLAREQLLLPLGEGYMHPSGQMPGCEWAFDEVTPPVHAWAARRVHRLERRRRGDADPAFLERVLHRSLLNFAWWVNSKSAHGPHLFRGGFLGLDNIGVFDRSARLPGGGRLAQADGTGWMAMYSLDLLRIALELGRRKPAYQGVASRLFEHFLGLASAVSHPGPGEPELWSERDGFFYDVLLRPDADGGGTEAVPIEVRSLVGLVPLLAAEALEPELLAAVPEFTGRAERLLARRPHLAEAAPGWLRPGAGGRRLLSLVPRRRLERLLERMLDPDEFLSDFGVRSLSRFHAETPYVFEDGASRYTLSYLPAESESSTYGRNSNWRGPIWLPVNYLIAEALERHHAYYGEALEVELPRGSGRRLRLDEAARELRRRLCALFLRDGRGRRPCFGDDERHRSDPWFRDRLLFWEYFHGDTGRGVGAAHQTGWTGLIANLLEAAAADAGASG